jgi:hypothetical protein
MTDIKKIKQRQEIIGSEATYDLDGIEFLVTIESVRDMFGREEFLIVPVSGSGYRWVTAKALSGLEGLK